MATGEPADRQIPMQKWPFPEFFPKMAFFRKNGVFPEKWRFSGKIAFFRIFDKISDVRRFRENVGPKIAIALELRRHFAEIGARRGTRECPNQLGNSQVPATVRISAANIQFTTAESDLISPTRHIRLSLFDNQKTKVFMEKTTKYQIMYIRVRVRVV